MKLQKLPASFHQRRVLMYLLVLSIWMGERAGRRLRNLGSFYGL
jgi:hypothetical protein